MKAVERRFGIEQIHLAGTADHEEEQTALRAGAKVCQGTFGNRSFPFARSGSGGASAKAPNPCPARDSRSRRDSFPSRQWACSAPSRQVDEFIAVEEGQGEVGPAIGFRASARGDGIRGTNAVRPGWEGAHSTGSRPCKCGFPGPADAAWREAANAVAASRANRLLRSTRACGGMRADDDVPDTG